MVFRHWERKLNLCATTGSFCALVLSGCGFRLLYGRLPILIILVHYANLQLHIHIRVCLLTHRYILGDVQGICWQKSL